MRRVLRTLLIAGVLAIVSAASIAFSLRVTPQQSVSALGQTVSVGTTAPTASMSGPGEVVLFGQSLPTKIRFVGPVRPRLVLTDISINRQVADLLRPEAREGVVAVLGERLAGGWRRYFVWEIVFTALGALLLLGSIVGWWRHHRTHGWKRTVATILSGLVIVEAVNIGIIMLTAFTAPNVLREVHTLGEMVGRTEQTPVRAATGVPLRGVKAVVIGDSTAAGLGDSPLPDPSELDKACGRSADSYAEVLARVNGWKVDNLGCTGATIRSGILGPQRVGTRNIPPQLAVAEKAADATAVVISIGANDMGWSSMVRLCAVQTVCDDRALTAYFQSALAGFTQDYYDLLRQLGRLPPDTNVVVDLYYVPFDPAATCLSDIGLTPTKVKVLIDRLNALNAVLANGAKTFGYISVQPDFSGHELCSQHPYVQGLEDPAPLHPNADGQLVIALADERALLGAR